MIERPILFSGPMVRAILDGRKTQTRRVAKCFNPLPRADILESVARNCPYGVPGDRLWVRETHYIYYGPHAPWPDLPHVASDLGIAYYREGFDRSAPRWRPSIHMPRWASRLTLLVTDVRVERVQDISTMDAKAEGVQLGTTPADMRPYYKMAFQDLWDSIYAKRGYGWDVNPLCWIVSFEAV